MAVKAAVTICCLAALSGCTHSSPLKATAAPTAPSLSADSLIVSLDDVRRIANYDDLNSLDLLDVRRPYNDHANDPRFPGRCQVVFDQDVAFGSNYKQFRSVQYSGASNRAVTQAVGIYPDEAAARAAFDRVTAELTACSELHLADLPFTVRKLDPSTVARCAEQCPHIYRVKSSVLIDVDVVHFSDSQQIANSVLQMISDRINTA
ncbi:sensor domain-containing protein [Mycobacterium kyorinense]|uniref:sensor domain-containing protein n=1 Tax=Mycobacterium kyorinense TaxID=487514 RepID=UPI0009DE14C1|nr:sensor domain-containing protein [Mycobacterium kyorinense]